MKNLPIGFKDFFDAESNFINLYLGHRFSFYFNIKLHLDNIKVHHYIKLEVGKIYTHKNTFRISKYKNYRNYLIF